MAVTIRIIFLYLISTIFLGCYAYISNTGIVQTKYFDTEKVSLKIKLIDFRCEKIKTKERIQDLPFTPMNEVDFCEKSKSFLKLEKIEKKLNDKYNIINSPRYLLEIKVMNSNDSETIRSKKMNESGIDLVARNLSLITLTIIPGWSRIEDEYDYSLFKNDKLLFRFKDFNSGYSINSIFFFPYFFFRSIDDIIYLRMDYIIKKNMELYFSLN